MGNARVTYAKNNVTGVLDILDKNNYYPFGMNHLDSNSGSFVGQSSYKNYKYNGKELQETGMYDYGARMYMPDIVIFGTHDPLSEVTLQPYAYAYNNPIFYNDPTGMEGEAAASDDGGGGEASNGGGGGMGEGFGGGGGCPPDCGGGNKGNGITPASMGNVPGGYDGAPREIAGAGVDDVAADHDIQGVGWTKKAQKNSLPVSGSVTLGGGGNGMKKYQPSLARQGWNFLADNIISKPIEGVQVVGYIFYGAFYALPKEAITRGKIENIHVKMDIVTWGLKNGSIHKNVYKDDANMTEAEKFDAFVKPGVAALTAPVSFGFKPFNSSVANWGFNTSVKAGVKNGIYQSAPKDKE